MNTRIKKFLEEHEIKYTLHTHPPVFTVAEAEIHCKGIPGLPGKNLFLKNKDKGVKEYFLIVMSAHTKLDLKSLAKKVNVKKLTFSPPEELRELLGLEPGSVSPFGLLNDPEQKVHLFIDQDIWNSDIVNFHPNENNASLELAKEDFHKYIKSLKRPFEIISLKSATTA